MEDRVYASEVAIELEAVGIATNHLLHREGAEPAVIELFRGSLCPDIPTVQPDLVANLKWFCLPVVSVVITCHIICRLLERRPSLLYRFCHSIRKLVSSFYPRQAPWFYSHAWMSSSV